MTISVSQLEGESFSRLPVREGQRVELKVSIFRAPKDSRYRQIENIAREMAAFMNSDGGDLYLGVKDDGQVTGIQDDLEALRCGLDETIVHGRWLDDGKWVATFRRANTDAYARKINQIAQGYLGKAASQLLDDVEFQKTEDGIIYARVHIRASAMGDVVYFQSSNSSWSEIFVRAQGLVQCLKDRDRDEFISRRAQEVASKSNAEEYRKLTEAVARLQNQLTGSVVSRIVADEADSSTVTKNSANQQADPDGVVAHKTEIDVCTPGQILSIEYCSSTSITAVMDRFEKMVGDVPRYRRLILNPGAGNLEVIPYKRIASGDGSSTYCRIGNVDFKFIVKSFVIDRPEKKKPYCPSEGLSFSSLKKGFWGAVSENLYAAFTKKEFIASSFDDVIEYPLSVPVSFYAHTTEIFGSCDPNVYEVVGVRLKKVKLYFHPDELNEKDYSEFKQLNASAMFAASVCDRRGEAGQNLERVCGQTTSVTSVMDEFEEKSNGQYKYSQLVLSRSGNGLTILPYFPNYHLDRYVNDFGLDFKLTKIQLIINRISMSGNQFDPGGIGVTFSEFKKGRVEPIGYECCRSISQGRIHLIKGNECEVNLSSPIAFRASTSDSLYEFGPNHPNVYAIVAIRFTKQPLNFHPDSMSWEEHREFDTIDAKCGFEKIWNLLKRFNTST